MARQYTLTYKLDALDQLQRNNGDIHKTSEQLGIPDSTLRGWRAKEASLRQHHTRQDKQTIARIKSDLHRAMLERGLAIMAHMDDERLEQAPLNQLATTLSALVNQALKLEETIKQTHEDQSEPVYRIEYRYNGSVHDTPPWADDRHQVARALQNRGMWETLGQDDAGQNHSAGERSELQDARMVARPDLSDVESGMAGFEGEPDRYKRYLD